VSRASSGCRKLTWRVGAHRHEQSVLQARRSEGCRSLQRSAASHRQSPRPARRLGDHGEPAPAIINDRHVKALPLSAYINAGPHRHSSKHAPTACAPHSACGAALPALMMTAEARNCPPAQQCPRRHRRRGDDQAVVGRRTPAVAPEDAGNFPARSTSGTPGMIWLDRTLLGVITGRSGTWRDISQVVLEFARLPSEAYKSSV
jgi:hypothetical protein